MNTFLALYSMLLGWMPVYIQVLVVGFIVFVTAWLIVKLIGRILDAIPFI